MNSSSSTCRKRPRSHFLLAVLCLSGMLLTRYAIAGGYPRDELAFCPSGGPPGWMNYFDHRDREEGRKKYLRHQRYFHSGPSGHSYAPYPHYQSQPYAGQPLPRYRAQR